MGFFARLFRKQPNRAPAPPEFSQAQQCLLEAEELKNADRYIARSDYIPLRDRYRDTAEFFRNMQKSGMLANYCRKNRIEEKTVSSFLCLYQDLTDLKKGSAVFRGHNEAYVARHLREEREYLDNILREVDPAILLDEEQRRAVLCDEDHMLVIAGAGTGKTTTVAAKVKYLVERKQVDPKKILVISFTNKAVGELKERINEGLKIPCPITTFHKTGLAVIRKKDDTDFRVAPESFLYWKVNDYLKQSVLQDPATVEKLILLFGSYFDAPYEGDDLKTFFNYLAKSRFSTMKGNLEEYYEEIIDRKTGRKMTIQDEVVRSGEEVRIANFLYMHGIDYEYEAVYPYRILLSRKPYTPDFTIRQGNKTAYIEHFGISEDGRHSSYSPEELARYKEHIQDKINLHKRHNTTLIITYSKHKDGCDFLMHLKEQLEENGFVLVKKPAEEIYKKITDLEENRYISRLTLLLMRFIHNFKTCGYGPEDFDRMLGTEPNVRTKLFLEIARSCYLEYQRKLAEKNYLDFEDMINESARLIREKQQASEKLDFAYIIVDEYQDISRQRYNLTKELSRLCSAKVIAVGDDWQSVYAFSGSDITLFTEFLDMMGYGEELKITRTYRNAQEVIDVAGSFVQRNDVQIKKTLKSPKHITKPVVVYSYSDSYDRREYKGKGGQYYHLGKQLQDILGIILANNKKEGLGGNSSVLLIGRYNFDARNLCYSRDFVYDETNGKVISKKYPQARLFFMTAHGSKGLGYDNVVIVNGRNGRYGFPCKIEDDPVMKYVTHDDSSMEYAEERRLFYVALTRTKNRVYILSPENHPSEFVTEILRDYKDVSLVGKLDTEEREDNISVKKCPLCGYPLRLRSSKSYGLPLWICTNEPEVCDFLTNDPAGGELQVQKCDWCRDGYLIVKKGKSKYRKTEEEYILGCTNYRENGTGCSRVINARYYERWRIEGPKDVSPAGNISPAGEPVPVELPLRMEDGGKDRAKKISDAQARAGGKTGPDDSAKEQKDPKDEPSGKEEGKTAAFSPAGKEEEEKKTSFENASENPPVPGKEERKKSGVHTTGKKPVYIEREGFFVITDDEGQVLTDTELLKRLCILRREIGRREKVSVHKIISNYGLVNLATFRPETREEYIELYGLGDATFEKYGAEFLAEIRRFYRKH